MVVRNSIMAVLAAGFIGLASAALAADQAKPKKLGGIGDARGFVVDADTGGYLGGAKVALLVPKGIEEIEGSSADSDSNGFYTIKASLGSSRSSVAWDRIGDLSIASLIGGGAKKTERHINVSQLNVSVWKDGYKPFSGTVRVVSASAEFNYVWLCPVKLAPDGSSYRSFAEPRFDLGQLDSVGIDPVTPSPGSKVTYRVVFSRLPLTPKSNPRVDIGIPGAHRWTSSKLALDGGKWACEGSLEMSTPGFGMFEKTRSAKPGVYSITVALSGDGKIGTYVSSDNSPHLKATRYVVVGVAADQSPAAAAATTRLNKLMADPGASRNEIRDAAQAVAAFAPQTDDLSLTRAFIEGRYQEAWASAKPLAKSLGTESPIIRLYRSAAAVRSNPADYESRLMYRIAANELFGQYDFATGGSAFASAVASPSFGPMPTPSSPKDTLSAARLALIEGRDKDAADLLSSLPAANQAQPPVRSLMAHCLYTLGRYDEAGTLYAQIFDVKKPSDVKDFYSQLDYARLEFRQGKPDQAEDHFCLALANGRNAGADYSATKSPVIISMPTGSVATYSMYTGPERSGVVGFAYAEGSLVQMLVDNYAAIAHPEDDPLSTAVAARALAELGLAKEAVELIKPLLASHPDNENLLLTDAVALKMDGEVSGAKSAVSQLLTVNPRHPEGLALDRSLSSPGD